MGYFYEDFALGQVFTTPGRTVVEADLVEFSGLTGDFNPLHTDAHFAAETPFGGRIAHGPLGLALAVGLMARLDLFSGTGLGLLKVEWTFAQPIFINDTLHVEVTIDFLRETSRPDRGIVSRRCRLINQRGVAVQEGALLTMVRRRP